MDAIAIHNFIIFDRSVDLVLKETAAGNILSRDLLKGCIQYTDVLAGCSTSCSEANSCNL